MQSLLCQNLSDASQSPKNPKNRTSVSSQQPVSVSTKKYWNTLELILTKLYMFWIRLLAFVHLHKDSVVLRDYMAYPGSEIFASTTTVQQWNWVPAEENISDLGTRAKGNIEEISEDSVWNMVEHGCAYPESRGLSRRTLPGRSFLKMCW